MGPGWGRGAPEVAVPPSFPWWAEGQSVPAGASPVGAERGIPVAVSPTGALPLQASGGRVERERCVAWGPPKTV